MKSVILFAIISFVLGQTCVQDPYFPNQSQQTAYVVNPVTQVFRGTLCSDSEVDWYTFSQNSGEYISAYLIYNRTAGNPDMEAFQQGVSGSLGSTNNGDYDSLTLLNGSPSAGTIYLRVYQSTCGYVQTAGVTYTLQIQRYQGTCQDDQNNGTNSNLAGAVQTTTPNVLAVLCGAFAQDWYRVTLQGGSTVDLVLVYSFSMMDIDLELLDSGGNSLSYVYTPTVEHISFAIPTTGTYYIRALTYSALVAPAGGYYALLIRGGGTFPAVINVGCTRPGGSTAQVTTGRVTTGAAQGQVTTGRVTTGVQSGQVTTGRVTTGIAQSGQVTTGAEQSAQVTTGVSQSNGDVTSGAITTGVENGSQTGQTSTTDTGNDATTAQEASEGGNSSGIQLTPTLIASLFALLMIFC